MSLWIETSLRYDKMQENGSVKKVTEKYLFEALTFTEAEARTTQELAHFISGEFSVSATKKTKISEIFFDTSDYADKWWLVKVNFTSLDEDNGQEKKSITQILVQAGDFRNALEYFRERMKDTISDYEIVSIAETPYMDVYPGDKP